MSNPLLYVEEPRKLFGIGANRSLLRVHKGHERALGVGPLRAHLGRRFHPAHPAAEALVQPRDDEEAYVAMNFVHHLTNFRRLVCGCMDSYDSVQSHILQHFSSSTR